MTDASVTIDIQGEATVSAPAEAGLIEETQSVTTVQADTGEVEETSKPKTAKGSAEQKKPTQAVKPKKQTARRPTLAERVEQQANPTTRLAGQQKTIVLPLNYLTDIMHEYLRMNQSTMLSAYERLAALLRMLSRDKELLAHANEWIAKNTEIAQQQISELQAQRAAIEDQIGDIDVPQINTPETYKTTFEASHPVANKMLAIAKAVDAELVACERLYFAGAVDDSEYAKLRDQATTIIRGSVDRIYKATKPGNREGGRFNPAELARWIREGNRMMFEDIPQAYQHIVVVGAAA
jgi:hypothetical protein